MDKWEEAQNWELNWHLGIGANTFREEEKQFIYAKKMGIEFYANPATPYNVKNYGTVLDVGGGEISLLLKVENPVGCVVVDPLDYPWWVLERYKAQGIDFEKCKAETFTAPQVFDEVWCYNCLQHVEDPGEICRNMRKLGKLIRIFEWIDNGISPGHIHSLSQEELDEWLGGQGKVEQINEKGCVGKAYFGVFRGNQ